MPDFDNDTDLLDGTDNDGTEQDDSAGGDNPPASPPASDDKSEKRIRDLQSKADAAEARANRLERLLAAAVSPEGAGSGDGEPKTPVKAPTLDAGAAIVLEFMRESVFQSTPVLEFAGYTAADLTGSTPAELRASAASLARKYQEQETRIRNKVLAEHGMAPEIVADNKAPSSADRDFSKMPSKDFNELMERVIKGG